MTILKQLGNVKLVQEGSHKYAQIKVYIKREGVQDFVVFTTHNPAQAIKAFEHYCQKPDEKFIF